METEGDLQETTPRQVKNAVGIFNVIVMRALFYPTLASLGWGTHDVSLSVKAPYGTTLKSALWVASELPPTKTV